MRARTSNPVLAYEAPAVAVLDRTGPRPEAFPFKGVALTFPQAGPTLKVPVLVRVPGRSLKYAPAAGQKDVMAADLAVVVRVRNEYQQEVSRVSQHFQLSSPGREARRRPRGRHPLLPRDRAAPGPVHCSTRWPTTRAPPRPASRASRSRCRLPGRRGPSSAASWSSTTSSRSRPPTATRSNPLYFGEMLVYPSLGDPLRKSVAKAMGFYFTARGPANARKGLLEVVRDGQVTARLPLDLPAPERDRAHPARGHPAPPDLRPRAPTSCG